MWIGIAFVVLFGLYLTWCLFSGKIFLTVGVDLYKQTKTIDRQDSAASFWFAWVLSAAGLVVFSVYLVRAVLS